MDKLPEGVRVPPVFQEVTPATAPEPRVEISPFGSEPHGPITPERLEERVALIRHVRETWKGNATYCATLDMEIWAMSLVARMLWQAVAEGVDSPTLMVEQFVASIETDDAQ